MELDIIEQIKQGDDEPLYDLYKLHRNSFIRWGVQRFNCSEEEAKDVFQEAVISFCENIKSGKLTVLTSDVKTYLFSIGRFYLLNLIKKNARKVTFTDLTLINVTEPTENIMESKEEEQFIKETVSKFLDKQCEDCKKVLELYYFHEKSMEEIAKTMGYKNANVAKKKKYECFKKLAQMVKQNMGVLIF